MKMQRQAHRLAKYVVRCQAGYCLGRGITSRLLRMGWRLELETSDGIYWFRHCGGGLAWVVLS